MNLGRGTGNPSARVMIVGEAWGNYEEAKGEPFVGPSGEELNRMLSEARIPRESCFVTNLVNARPPYGDVEQWIPKQKKNITSKMVGVRGKLVDPIVRDGYAALLREIGLVRPDLIIALGSSALWALTGAEGIQKWRGSQLYLSIPFDTVPPGVSLPDPVKVVPTIHPAAIMREWSWRRTAVHDLRRAAEHQYPGRYRNEPDWRFILRPTISTALGVLTDILRRLETGTLDWLSFDLETKKGHIACAGLAWSRTEAICIPFMTTANTAGYWSHEEEAKIVYLLYRILTHPRAKVRGQNLLYDAQYTYRHWHFVPRVAQDTMITHHSIYSGLAKALDFQASMYCDHYVWWKEDGKTWENNSSEEQLWRYNCVDCVRTQEVGEVNSRAASQLKLDGVDSFQQRFFWPVLQAMQRGVRINERLRAKFDLDLQDEIAAREEWFKRALGHPLNPDSSKQMQALFYNDFGCKPNYKKGKPGMPRALTLDDKALEKIAFEEPILRPLIRRIQEWRSLGVFLSTFVRAQLDADRRMRCSFNICGTETYRFASSKNAFGSGTNLQNVPKGGEDDDSGLVLPNIRELFIPDEGFKMFDIDLSKADLRIVVWEAGEEEMKAMLAEGRDPYVETAREFYRDPSLAKTRPDGAEDPRYRMFKSFCHGTHYLGTPVGLAQRLGLTVAEAERTQRWYFGKYPRIPKWQAEFKRAVASRMYVENIFGYRRYYFDRPDEAMFREAIAWLPQSTVALYINRIWMNLYEKFPHIWVLLQVHDSLVGQFPAHREDECKRQIREAARIELPYPDPLVIPIGFKASHLSWGHCE